MMQVKAWLFALACSPIELQTNGGLCVLLAAFEQHSAVCDREALMQSPGHFSLRTTPQVYKQGAGASIFSSTSLLKVEGNPSKKKTFFNQKNLSSKIKKLF